MTTAKDTTKSKTRDGIEIYRATWDGVELEIRFERNWLGSPPSEFHPSHVEVETIAPPRAPLPITETGYRSIFVSVNAIDKAGGAVAFVIEALNEAARRQEWKARVAAQRQLSLF